MAHKLLPLVDDQPTTKRIKMPSLSGKFGLSLYVFKKEIFIGIQLGEVEIEQIVRKRFVKASKSKVAVFKFD